MLLLRLTRRLSAAHRDSNGHLNGALTNGHASDGGKGSGKGAGRGRRRVDEETAGLLAEQRTAGEASTSAWQELQVRVRWSRSPSLHDGTDVSSERP